MPFLREYRGQSRIEPLTHTHHRTVSCRRVFSALESIEFRYHALMPELFFLCIARGITGKGEPSNGCHTITWKEGEVRRERKRNIKWFDNGIVYTLDRDTVSM